MTLWNIKNKHFNPSAASCKHILFFVYNNFFMYIRMRICKHISFLWSKNLFQTWSVWVLGLNCILILQCSTAVPLNVPSFFITTVSYVEKNFKRQTRPSCNIWQFVHLFYPAFLHYFLVLYFCASNNIKNRFGQTEESLLSKRVHLYV